MGISIKDSDSFAKELVSKILETGFYGMSKTDLYDYVLFLMNKYSENQFLKTNSNFENARLLKLSEQKVKNLKLNINLKFVCDEPEIVIADFFSKLTEKNFHKTDEKYEFVLDDSYTRMCIESVLKKNGNTLDYKINTEKVQIDAENLKNFLSSYAEGLNNQLQTKELKDEVLKIGVNILDKACPVPNVVSSIVNIGKIILKNT